MPILTDKILILPEPELLVIFFCMSLKKPRVGIFFIFSSPVLILIHGFLSKPPLMQMVKVSTSSVILSSWGMMNPLECSGYFQGIWQILDSLRYKFYMGIFLQSIWHRIWSKHLIVDILDKVSAWCIFCGGHEFACHSGRNLFYENNLYFWKSQLKMRSLENSKEV